MELESVAHLAISNRDIITALVWLFITTGASLLSVLIWIGRQLGKRLTGIEDQLKLTNATLVKIEREARDEIESLDRRQSDKMVAFDRRLAIVESRCEYNHKQP